MKYLASCIAAVGLLASGCSMHAMTGDLISELTWLHVNPYLLSTSDSEMACETAISTGGMLMAYSRVTDMPNKAAIGVFLTAASCAEADAAEAELSTIRALRQGDAEAAQDARITQRRAHTRAARRLHQGWKHMVAHYGDPATACPTLDDPSDELAWFMGNLAGASSVEHDRAGGAEINIPLDIPLHASKGIACLDDARWFGIPSALQASVWLSVPGATPEGRDPWATLDEAQGLADAAGVRMAHLLRTKAALGAGNVDLAKATIRALVASQEATEPPDEWRLLDQAAREQVLALSDALWAEATGHRTPHRGLGTFWDDVSDMVGDEDLLNDIDAEADDAEGSK